MSLRAQQHVPNTLKSQGLSHAGRSTVSQPLSTKLHIGGSWLFLLIMLAALTISMLLLSKLMSDSMVIWEIPNFSTSLQPGLAPSRGILVGKLAERSSYYSTIQSILERMVQDCVQATGCEYCAQYLAYTSCYIG
jgi:hypothetical protein